MRNCGDNFPLANDSEILKINSPRKYVTGGPYIVVYKDITERWAIVVLDWEGEPRLAIRWFWEDSGNPVSTSHATWFCLPKPLYGLILNGLTIAIPIREIVEQYLSGKIDGKTLQILYLKFK